MNRRRFLRSTACCAVALGAVPAVSSCHATGKPARAWTARLSTSSIHYRDLPLEQACERIAALGFEAVDIWSAYESCPHLDDALQRLGSEGLKTLLQRTGLDLAAFSTYVGGYTRYAGLLGGIGGGVAIQGSAAPCAPADLVPRMRDFFTALKPLAELAEQHQSWLAIENHGDALLDGLDSFKAFVDLNPHPRIGIALAPYHLQAGKASVEEAIRIAGPQLLFFYAWQHQPGLGQLPGHGPTDFAPWLQALRDIRYPRHVNAFMHGHPAPDAMSEALARSRNYLRQLSS